MNGICIKFPSSPHICSLLVMCHYCGWNMVLLSLENMLFHAVNCTLWLSSLPFPFSFWWHFFSFDEDDKKYFYIFSLLLLALRPETFFWGSCVSCGCVKLICSMQIIIVRVYCGGTRENFLRPTKIFISCDSQAQSKTVRAYFPFQKRVFRSCIFMPWAWLR